MRPWWRQISRIVPVSVSYSHGRRSMGAATGLGWDWETKAAAEAMESEQNAWPDRRSLLCLRARGYFSPCPCATHPPGVRWTATRGGNSSPWWKIRRGCQFGVRRPPPVVCECVLARGCTARRLHLHVWRVRLPTFRLSPRLRVGFLNDGCGLPAAMTHVYCTKLLVFATTTASWGRRTWWVDD
jgi:hypothetical protein